MEAIDRNAVQQALNRFLQKDAYFHMETSTGSYRALEEPGQIATCAYIRNGVLHFLEGKITGEGPYQVGLKLKNGWLYSQGLTDWELTKDGKLLLGGYDGEGHLNIALQFSFTPFECGA
ncbi:DUF1806 family protein [Virgibacillus sp. 179-BFC.A HS]|uniref:DUF1806 family protein n=2 Tax=Tigheibacillus jepli TaxID=3035914 RepID=A0ABU5CFF3_9BACI|nr:DUF1806 family protein [Virgibacillus sp. 179-BFC.A HS]MDY0404945.1 DUF1806 family protein [Virgibacillus sp. 179-BFC.A HS]